MKTIKENKMLESKLVKSQYKKFDKGFVEDGIKKRIYVTIRYDDECGNGHNSFAITGSIYNSDTSKSDKYYETGGCIHDEIIKHFPEFEKYIKWHLCNSDSPIHYIANTVYHARDRSHPNVEIGDPVKWKQHLKFDNIPFTFNEQTQGFWDYLNNVGDFNNIDIVEIPYDGKDNYSYSPNYSLTGFIKENETRVWYKAPFKNIKEATEFLEALRLYSFEIVDIPIEWCQAVKPNLKAARSCAIWEDATLEQLQSKEILEARLPQLMLEFKNDMEELGFVF